VKREVASAVPSDDASITVLRLHVDPLDHPVLMEDRVMDLPHGKRAPGGDDLRVGGDCPLAHGTALMEGHGARLETRPAAAEGKLGLACEAKQFEPSACVQAYALRFEGDGAVAQREIGPRCEAAARHGTISMEADRARHEADPAVSAGEIMLVRQMASLQRAVRAVRERKVVEGVVAEGGLDPTHHQLHSGWAGRGRGEGIGQAALERPPAVRAARLT